MPTRPGRSPRGSATQRFTDRTSESTAFADSLDAVELRLRAPAFDDPKLRNVLVFHGNGGMGKTELSKRLEDWSAGRASAVEHWGPPPRPTPVRIARWDVSGLDAGTLDIPTSLIALRAALVSKGQSWPAFTLAVTYYLSSTRPGQPLPTVGSRDQTSQVVDVLRSIAMDLGAADIVTKLSASVVQSVARRVIKRAHESRTLRRFPTLVEILQRCEELDVGEEDPELVSDILWLLTQEVEAVTPEKRPLSVIFIDHFEKVQGPRALVAERTVNQFIGALPWVLVVITGRHRVDWDRPRDGLALSGSDWPNLREGVTEEPRQHLLGRLSFEDTREYLERRAEIEGWALDPETGPALLDEVARSTDGWPLHIDAVCNTAALRMREIDESGGLLAGDDLLGELPDLVKRFFEHFSEEETRVFNAACLLPFFDLELVAAVAQTTVGSVERAVRMTSIDSHPSDIYPYRVHEELRRLVRAAGIDVTGGWAPADWRAAAERCLAEAGRRHGEAHAASEAADLAGAPRNDAPVLDAIVLGLTVAAVEGVFNPWLVEAVRTAPTIRGLSPRLPKPATPHGDSDAWSVVAQIHALARPMREAIPTLRAIFESNRAASRSAGLWRAYRLRSTGDYDGAIAQLEEQIALPGTTERQTTLYRHQASVTLRAQRRFRDALAYREEHGLDTSVESRFRPGLERYHGIHGHDRAVAEEHVRKQESQRFRLELRTTALRTRVREGVDCREQARELLRLATDLGEPSHAESCLLALGLLHLRVPDAFEETLAEIQRLEKRLRPQTDVVHLLAMRALDSGRRDDIDRAVAAAEERRGDRRAAGWIATEVILEELGHPLPPSGFDEQWIIPYEQVRHNWLTTAQTVIELAARIADE